jgi:hypothetical protein
LRENKDIKLIYLPVGSPELNSAETLWFKGKKAITPKHHLELKDLQNDVSEFYRTTRFKIDIYKYIYRKTHLFIR